MTVLKREDRDTEARYSKAEFISKLRRLADCLENDEAFTIQISGERIAVPRHATVSVEHEREDGEEEIEFQIKWTTKN